MPWQLRCAWCGFHVEVLERGGRGRDQGAGVEAAAVMHQHIAQHGKTWAEFMARPASSQEGTSDD